MPDKWGRIGYNDFMGLAKGLSSIQAMGQRSTELAEKKQFNADYEGNMAALGAGPQKVKPYEVDGAYVSPDKLEQPVEMVGSQRSRIAAKNDFSIGLQADLNIADAKQGAEVNSLSEKITAWKSANPNATFDQVPIEFTAGVAGQKAKASVIGLYGESAEAQKTFMENRMAIIHKNAVSFSDNKNLVNDALGAGNTDMAVNGLIQMSKELTAIPYQLGDYDPETKSFELKYFDRRTGKLQKNGTKSLDEVVQEMNAMGQKEVISAIAFSMETKRKENIVEEANPKHGKTTGGTATLVTAQVNPLKQDSTVEITVRNEKTGETIATYPSWDAFYDAGNSKEDLKRTKALADIGSVNALKGQRDSATNFNVARTNALGKTGGPGRSGAIKIDETFYDDQGNSYKIKSETDRVWAKDNNLTRKNPKMNKDMYENNVKALSIQFPGITKDAETETYTGIINENNWESVLKAANDLGLDLIDEHDGVFDTNGMWPGGKERSVKVSVMPMGTNKSGGDPGGIKEKGGKFDSDVVDSGTAGGDDSGTVIKKDRTNAMGKKTNAGVPAPSGNLSFLPKNLLDKINDVEWGARTSKKHETRGLFNDIGNNIQENFSVSQPDKYIKFGETEIEKELRLASGMNDNLGSLKNVADILRAEYPDKTDKEIGSMVAGWAGGKPHAPAMGR